MRVLVIDDSKAMRSILKNILTEWGYEVLEASNGEEALKRLKETGKIALALVDWNMPKMSGFDFIKAVRAEHAYDGMIMMMVTSENEMSQVERAFEAGVNEYVMKPFTKDIILEKLKMLGFSRRN